MVTRFLSRQLVNNDSLFISGTNQLVDLQSVVKAIICENDLEKVRTIIMNVLGLFALPDWLAVFIIFISTLYVYFTWHFDYWKNQNVKTSLYIPFLGSMWANLFYTVHEADTKNYKTFGKMWGTYEIRNPALMVADLDLIKQITVKDFQNFPERRTFPLGGKSKITRLFISNMDGGDEWKFHRSVLSPTFTSGKLRQMGNLMENCGNQMVKNFHVAIKKEPDDMDLKKILGLYTMDVIATCCFGYKMNSENPQDPFIIHAKMLFDRSFVLIGIAMTFMPKLIERLNISIFPAKCLSFFEKAIHQVVEMRKQENSIRSDFLQLLLDAKKESEEKQQSLNIKDESKEDHKQPEESSNGFDSSKAKPSLTIDEEAVVAHSMLFLIAGFDTTANTISLVIYSLATNPDCQDKLIQEIDEVLAEHGKLTHEAVMGMRYLDMVISESLRLFPPGTRLERRCSKNYILGGIKLKEGMMVAIPVWGIHHSEEYYPNPEKFDPERFTPENKAKRDPASYIPFGAGPRNCIGMRFALMEAKIAVANFFSEFRASPSSKTQIPMKFRPGMPFLLPTDGFHLKVEKRRG